MIDIVVTALPYLISVATAFAGYFLTGYVQERWQRRTK
jgi:hypothetical protein